MIAIPLPFVVALLLAILAILLFIRREEATASAFIFVSLCAFTTMIVGLRWTFDWPIFRLLQPILAACIPMTAWFCFRHFGQNRFRFAKWLHLIPPLLITLASFGYPTWHVPIDPFLTFLYCSYGIALLRRSLTANDLPQQVRFSDMSKAIGAERAAGIMLLISACIDAALALDFALFQGQHAIVILSIGHATLLPILACSVILFSQSMVPNTNEQDVKSAPNRETAQPNEKEKTALSLTSAEAQKIVDQLDALFASQQSFLDPDLTLDRLARKMVIPARQISMAVNQIHGRNVSQVVNEYRIERAKQLLLESDKSITQIYLDSGFQTKSNFNREFARVTQQTPSAFRRSRPLDDEESPN